jgi:hypothetical protein
LTLDVPTAGAGSVFGASLSAAWAGKVQSVVTARIQRGRALSRSMYVDQIAALVSLVALINAANRINVIVRNPAGSYVLGMFAAMTS